MRVKLLYLIIFLISGLELMSQDYIFNSNYNFPIQEKNIYYKGLNTSLKPVTGLENPIFDSLIFNNYSKTDYSLLKRKLLYEHTYKKTDDRHLLIINPIFDFRISRNINENDFGYQNTRGVNMFGRLNSRIWFNTSFYENQAIFPAHIDTMYSRYGVIPGYSRIKQFGDNNEAFDFMTAFGSVGFKATNKLNFTLATDNLFIGDGYRSMLLSDYTCAYLYFKTSYNLNNKLSFNHIISHALNPNYNNIMNLDGVWGENMQYPGKIISYNYLLWKINKNIHLGFFEAVVFDASDDNNIWNSAALNPLPYVNTSIYGFDNTNNVLAGLNLSYQNKKLGVFYSQFLIDKIDVKNKYNYGNRMAWQFGYKNFDFLNIDNLLFQAEYNHADVLTYSHNEHVQHYGHFNQALAHPAGSGFDEIVLISKYSYKNLALFARISYLKYKYHGSFDMRNIFNQDDFLNFKYKLSEGSEILYFDSQLIYSINRTIGLQAFGGITVRADALYNVRDYILQIGLRTALRANYYDY